MSSKYVTSDKQGGRDLLIECQVFVANPNKSDEVRKILIRNRDRLLKFLPSFLEERAPDDEQFSDEKAFIIHSIELLPSTT